MELWHIGHIVTDYQDLAQFLHLQLLGCLRDLALLLDDAAQRRLVPLVPVRLLPFGVPAVIDVDGRAKDVDSPKHAAILLQNQADQSPILMARGKLGFIPKTPLPGQRRPSATLSSQYRRRSVFFTTYTPCRQSCCGNRIAPPNPAVATGLPHPILLWQQDCHCQSWAGRRIASPNPAVATGLPRCTTSSSGLELFFPEHRLVMESARL